MTREDLMMARLAVRSISAIFTDGRYVWLDVKKTAEEMRPARMTHRAHEALSDIAGSAGDTHDITKNMRAKTVESQGKRVGYSLRGEWRWAKFGQDSFAQELLEMAKSCVESD
eukprot:11634234-Alexandrium_andersonii.AAC.1